MQTRLIAVAALLLLAIPGNAAAQYLRETLDFNEGWRFHPGDATGADAPGFDAPGFDDAAWRMLDLPHDWSIEGSFSPDHPATTGGGALPGGVGWYRKTFAVPSGGQGRLTFVTFDGIYRNSEVWINGRHLGRRPNGYASFQYDLTPYLRDGENVLAVRVVEGQDVVDVPPKLSARARVFSTGQGRKDRRHRRPLRGAGRNPHVRAATGGRR